MSEHSTLSTPLADPAAAVCPTCEHDLSGHDRIGLRWCAVTGRDHSDRQCLCSHAVASARTLRHY